MAEEATDVVPGDITPEDFLGDEQETPEAKSSTAEPKTPAADDKTPAEPVVPPEGDEEVVPPEAPADDDAAADEPGDKPAGKLEERKAGLNTEIRDLVAQRNALRAEVEKANAEAYQPATEEELIADGSTATDAKVEALRQRIEMKDYNDKVADAQLTIESESQRVLTDFPSFNPDSKEYDSELADEAAELLQANLIVDPNSGQVIGSNVSPYKLYQTLARAQGISAAKGQIRGQRDTEKMLANADAPGSAAPPSTPKDPVLALWESD